MSSHNPETPYLKPIYSAAQRLLDSNAGRSFTMDQLAKECGISRATLYRHVGNRETLLQRLANELDINIEELETPDIGERILQATRRALGNSGSVNFTIDQVAEEAGIGVATIYRHFGNKDELLQALAKHMHPRQAALDLLESDRGDLREDLIAFVESAIQFMYDIRDLAPVYFSSDPRTQNIFTKFRGDQNRTIHSLTKYLQDQMDGGKIISQEPFDIAIALMGMIVGFAFFRPTYRDDIPAPDLAAQSIVNICLHGITNEENP